MTLLQDLDDLATLRELAPQVRERVRAHADRLRNIFADPRMVFAFEAPDIREDVWRRINGGDITPSYPVVTVVERAHLGPVTPGVDPVIAGKGRP